jgi:hypothetical protein
MNVPINSAQNFSYMLTITNMATMRNYEIMSGKYNATGTCTGRNYEQKWITKLHNC